MTVFYLFLQGLSYFYLVILGSSRFYWVLEGFPGHEQVLLGFMSCVQIFPETRVDKIRLSRSIKERTYLEADLVGSDGGVAADGVGGGDGRRVDLGVGVVGRRRRVEAPAAVVHLEPIEHRRAVDQVAGDAAQPRHVLTQQPPQRHLAPNANVSFPIGRRNQRRSATSWHSIRPRIGRVSGSSDRFRVGGWVGGWMGRGRPPIRGARSSSRRIKSESGPSRRSSAIQKVQGRIGGKLEQLPALDWLPTWE